MIKLVILTNIPAPYRTPVFNILSKSNDIDLSVIYCAKSESNRKWDSSKFSIEYKHFFLKENYVAKRDGFNFIHNNFDIINQLKKIKPDVVITSGYSPTFLYAWLYAITHKITHIPMTDGWVFTERNLSILHKMLRKMVFATSKAFIGASKKSLELFQSYKIPKYKLFQSHLAIDNNKFSNKDIDKRTYDIIYSGHLDERKNVLFLAKVLSEVNSKYRIKLLVLGSGNKQKEFFEILDNAKVEYSYPGFVDQADLPKYYNDAKIFLFPTKLDPWGVVVNEAMASGTPVITTPFAGVCEDLVIEKRNGLILELDEKTWVDTIFELLNTEATILQYSKAAIEDVQKFNFEVAAQGIEQAALFAFNGKVK